MYNDVKKSFKLYWELYGGWKSIKQSFYLHLSVLSSFAVCFIGINPDKVYLVVRDVLPSLIGFSLGGYAILTAFGDEKFRGILCESEEGECSSPFMKINGTFVHFLFVQVVALALSVFGDLAGIVCLAFVFVVLVVFFYSLFLALAAAFAVLALSKWYDYHKGG